MTHGERAMQVWRTVSAAALLGATAACGGAEGIRDTMGLTVPPPDEYMVVSHAPLTLPPDLTALPPPQPGAPSRVVPDAQAAARSALAGTTTVAAASQSPAEQALLASAGPADPAIRQTLRAEQAAEPTTRRFGLDSFFGVRINQNPQSDAERLDPREEAERLRRAGVAAPVAPPAVE